MIPCQRAAELITLALDQPLTWSQRLALSLHLCLCGMCRRFSQQMRVLQRAAREADAAYERGPALPEAARARIADRLRQPPGPDEKVQG